MTIEEKRIVIDELKKIKSELAKEYNAFATSEFGNGVYKAYKIIDNHISELEGE